MSQSSSFSLWWSFMLSLIPLSDSLFACPGGGLSSLFGLGGYGGGYGGGGGSFGTQCGPESIFHHWTCCDYNAYDCCIELETWVVILLVLLGFGFMICLCGCLAACVWGMRRRDMD